MSVAVIHFVLLGKLMAHCLLRDTRFQRTLSCVSGKVICAIRTTLPEQHFRLLESNPRQILKFLPGHALILRIRSEYREFGRESPVIHFENRPHCVGDIFDL